MIYAGDRLLGAVRAVATGPTVSLGPQAVSAGESSGSASVSVVLTTPGGAPLACPVMVSYTTNPGTAALTDYTDVHNTIAFPAGSANGSVQPVSVPITSDTFDEDDETVFVDLTDAVGAALDAASRATITITDDDPSPTVNVAGASVPEGNSGTTLLNFPVSIAAASGRDVTVSYATVNGTATAGPDYTAASGTARLVAGTTSTTVPVTVLGDTAYEANETVTLQLSNPVGAMLGTSSATARSPMTMRICRRGIPGAMSTRRETGWPMGSRSG